MIIDRNISNRREFVPRQKGWKRIEANKSHVWISKIKESKSLRNIKFQTLFSSPRSFDEEKILNSHFGKQSRPKGNDLSWKWLDILLVKLGAVFLAFLGRAVWWPCRKCAVKFRRMAISTVPPGVGDCQDDDDRLIESCRRERPPSSGR